MTRVQRLRLSLGLLKLAEIIELADNCGIGGGGFEKGNTCGKGDGSGGGSGESSGRAISPKEQKRRSRFESDLKSALKRVKAKRGSLSKEDVSRAWNAIMKKRGTPSARPAYTGGEKAQMIRDLAK